MVKMVKDLYSDEGRSSETSKVENKYPIMKLLVSLTMLISMFAMFCSGAKQVQINREYLGKRLAEVDFPEEEAAETRSYLHRILGKKPKLTAPRDSLTSLRKLLNMETDETLQQKLVFRTKSGATKTKYQETFMGIPVYGSSVTASNADLTDVTGSITQDINSDVKSIRPKLSASAALAKVKTAERDTGSDVSTEVVKNELTIYTDESGTARLAYAINYFRTSDARGPGHPYYFIDANTGNVLRHWQGLAEISYIKANGGNKRTGKILRTIQVEEKNGKCTMKNEYVRKVVNMKGKLMKKEFEQLPAEEFSCTKGPKDEANGAYSPLVDAMLWATNTVKMYREWFPDIPSWTKKSVTVRVHHNAKDPFKAYWLFNGANFGDGMKTVHPMIATDTVAHEISHGFTNQFSQLEYNKMMQSGGINEAFSDIAGEAAEVFLTGDCDWKVGTDIIKKKSLLGGYFGRDALRYFDLPSKDKVSLDHANQFRSEGVDVHQSSGVYNRAFYELVKVQGMDFRKAFELFVYANMNYWRSQTDYADGLCGLKMTVLDRYSADKVADVQRKLTAAFKKVGVNACENIGMETLLKNKQIEAITMKKGEEKMYEFFVPGDCVSYNIVIGLEKGKTANGKISIYEKQGNRPTATDNDFKETGVPEITISRKQDQLSRTSAVHYILLKAEDDVAGYTMKPIFYKQTYNTI